MLFASHWGFEKGYSFNAPIWSVSIEIGLYCIFYLFCIVRIHKTAKLVGVLFFAYCLTKLGFGGRWSFPFLAFFIGGLTYEITNFYLNHRNRVTDALIVTAAVLSWTGVLTSDRIEYWLLTRGNSKLIFLYPVTIVALVISETRFPDIPRRAAWIGNLTYASYLLHFPLQLIFVLCFFAAGYENSVFQSVPVLVAFFGLLTILSLLTYQGFERPMQDVLRLRLLPKIAGESSIASVSHAKKSQEAH